MGLNGWIPAFAGITIWRIVYFARGTNFNTSQHFQLSDNPGNSVRQGASLDKETNPVII